jgi:hypothetical protein
METLCQNCKFSATFEGVDHCRRHAPSAMDVNTTLPLTNQNMYVFARVVLTSDWCGEFEPAISSAT